MKARVTKATVALLAAGAMLFSTAGPALAYPVGQNPTIDLAKDSAIRPGSELKVKAKNIKKDCEVTFRIADSAGARYSNSNEDYDISSAFVGSNYQTTWTGIRVPETIGVYQIEAESDSTCAASNENNSLASANKNFQVGKVTRYFATGLAYDLAKKTINFTGKLQVRPTLNGDYSALAGQSVTIVAKLNGLVQAKAGKVVTTGADGSFALAVLKPAKGTWSFEATYAGNTVYGKSVLANQSQTVASLVAKATAARAAAQAAALRKAAISKLTR